MLNWIVWNRTVFAYETELFETELFLTLKLSLCKTELFELELFWHSTECEQKIMLIRNWIVGNRTVWWLNFLK